MTDVVTSKDRPKYLRLEEQGEQTSHRTTPARHRQHRWRRRQRTGHLWL